MDRRAFVRTFTGGLLTEPLAVQARPAGKVGLTIPPSLLQRADQVIE